MRSACGSRRQQRRCRTAIDWMVQTYGTQPRAAHAGVGAVPQAVGTRAPAAGRWRAAAKVAVDKLQARRRRSQRSCAPRSPPRASTRSACCRRPMLSRNRSSTAARRCWRCPPTSSDRSATEPARPCRRLRQQGASACAVPQWIDACRNLIRFALALVAALFVRRRLALTHSRSTTCSASCRRSRPARIRSAAATSSRTSRALHRAATRPAYWEGRGGGGTGYVTDLLVDPAHAFVVERVAARRPRACMATSATARSPFGNLVCYPTTDSQRPRRLPVAERQGRCRTCSAAPAADLCRRSRTLSRAAVLARIRRQPDLQRLHRGAEAVRESRLCRRRTVSWRLALSSMRASSTLDDLLRAILDFSELHGDAGDPAAVAAARRSTPCSPTRASRRGSTPTRIGGFGASARRRIAAADARREADRIASACRRRA